MNRILALAAFSAGLGVVAWVAFGYLGSNPLALLMTLLIAGFYLVGGAELRLFRQATDNLHAALAALHGAPQQLGDWLATLHPSLQNAVRLRIEGERVGLPGPSVTPYLVGLLVLLGMLGTFLGMVVTLNGAVMALETTTDLATIRAALAAPIKGLGLAFGTSVAGVAASAMLGLVSVICRRERLQAVQRLDTRIATDMRGFSRSHQREQMLESMQLQARLMPELVDSMQSMMARMERHGEQFGERLVAGQERFHAQAQTTYEDLASSVERSLRDSLTESARVAGATIQPAVEATMAGITRETAAFQAHLVDSVDRQLAALASRFDATVTGVADVWNGALANHQSSSESLAADLRSTLAGFNEGFAQRADSLLVSVQQHNASTQGDTAQTIAAMAAETRQLHARIAETTQHQLDGITQRLGETTTTVADSWRDALAQQRHDHAQLSGTTQSALTAVTATLERQSAALLATVERAHATLQSDLASGDRQRLAAWTGTLEAMAQSLRDDAQQAGARALAQQEQICRTLEQTAREVHAQAEARSRETIDQMSRLIDAASDAPRAAAEVVGALCAQLSDSMVRDTEMLQERSRIMGTLGKLLDAVNQAADEQRAAIDALVASSAAMLQQAGARFDEKIEGESGKLATVSAQVAGSAIEVASMGEAFGAAVQQFGASSEALTDHLQRIEAALSRSTARSDEQLAYYVAQAREIVDLSISSQKQIVDDLQRLSIRQTSLAGEVA